MHHERSASGRHDDPPSAEHRRRFSRSFFASVLTPDPDPVETADADEHALTHALAAAATGDSTVAADIRSSAEGVS